MPNVLPRDWSRVRRSLALPLTVAVSIFVSVPLAVPAASQVTGLADCRFSQAQVFDIQWNPGLEGNTLLRASGFNLPYASYEPGTQRLTAGQIAEDDTFGFFQNGDDVGFRQFTADGTLIRTLHLSGTFTAIGDDFLFYNGDGSWGTLVTSGTGYAYGDAADLAVSDADVTLEEAVAYTSCSATALAVGQTRAEVEEAEEEPETDDSGVSDPPPAPAPTPIARPGGGLPVLPPERPEASRNGAPVEPTTTAPDEHNAEFAVGDVTVRVDMVAGGAGAVEDEGATLRVTRDGIATIGGGGLRSGEVAEVWLPLPDGASRRIALLRVGEDGAFEGALPFTGELDGQGPLPIGDRTLQFYGLDTDGQLTVLNVGVRIEQPGPLAPEPERAPGMPPTLSPGQTLATNAGLPTAVTVTPDSDARTTRVQGDGWLMDVDVPTGTVRDENGAPVIEIVRGDDSVVRGTGFMPGTRAYVWLMSDPTFLGEVTVDADGSFAGAVSIEDVEVGPHTLQLSGVGTDGYVRAANLGVIVTGGLVPSSIPAGDGPARTTPAPLLALLTLTLAAMGVGLLGRRGFDGAGRPTR